MMFIVLLGSSSHILEGNSSRHLYIRLPSHTFNILMDQQLISLDLVPLLIPTP